MSTPESQLDLDLVGFGNALVDVLSHQEDEFIVDEEARRTREVGEDDVKVRGRGAGSAVGELD